MPIELATLAAFVAAAGILVLTPGPDTILILRYTMNSGHRVGLATVMGVQLGLLVHTAAAVFGLSLVIASSPLLFKGIAVAGALYLAWLAIQSVRAGVMRLDGDGDDAGLGLGAGPKGGAGARAGIGAGKALRDAVLCNVLNPKVILLFLALMPNFVETGRDDVPAQLAVLGVVLILVNAAYQVPLTLAADAARRWLGSPAVQACINWGTGAVLLLFAGVMLYEHIF